MTQAINGHPRFGLEPRANPQDDQDEGAAGDAGETDEVLYEQ